MFISRFGISVMRRAIKAASSSSSGVPRPSGRSIATRRQLGPSVGRIVAASREIPRSNHVATAGWNTTVDDPARRVMIPVSARPHYVRLRMGGPTRKARLCQDELLHETDQQLLLDLPGLGAVPQVVLLQRVAW